MGFTLTLFVAQFYMKQIFFSNLENITEIPFQTTLISFWGVKPYSPSSFLGSSSLTFLFYCPDPIYFLFTLGLFYSEWLAGHISLLRGTRTAPIPLELLTAGVWHSTSVREGNSSNFSCYSKSDLSVSTCWPIRVLLFVCQPNTTVRPSPHFPEYTIPCGSEGCWWLHLFYQKRFLQITCHWVM